MIEGAAIAPPEAPRRAPWCLVTAAAEAENAARRPRRGRTVPAPTHGWHWRLTLACGHRVTRPCRQRREGAEVVNVPAPSRVRCATCGSVGRPAPVDGRDRDVRPRLLASLASATWVREECHLGTDCRVDVAAVIDGEVRGYEIKAASDSLRRLTPPHGFQVSRFSWNFDRVTLVCADRHLAPAAALVPAWWGLVRASDLAEVRPAGANPGDPVARLARLFWSHELRALASSLKLPARGLDKGRLAGLFRPEHEPEMRRALAAALAVRTFRKAPKSAPRPAAP